MGKADAHSPLPSPFSIAMTASAVADPLAHLSSEEELQRIDAWWRAANYLAVGMIYLRANALLAEPLRPEHIKARLLGRAGRA